MTSLRAFLSVAFLCLGAATTANANDSRLRIETGMHLGAIHLLSGEASGRYLVTVGSDSSVRIWDALRGSLLRTLYIPAPADVDAQKPIAALSTDGQTLAMTTNAPSDAMEPKSTLTLLDWRSGQVRSTLSIDGMIARLIFAPLENTTNETPRRLAALSAQGAVMIYDARDGTQIAKLSCDEPCVDIDFDGAGRLLTLSAAGGIKLYDAALQPRGEARLPQRMKRARVSPDGSRVAVSAADSGQLGVYSVPGLRLLYEPELRGLQATADLLIGWSPSGGTLYGSVAVDNSRGPARSQLRRWSAAGQGTFTDSVQDDAAITALVPLAQEGLALAASPLSLGVVAANQKYLWRHQRTLAYFSAPDSVLQIDATGANIRFSIDGKTKLGFSLSDRSIQKSTPFGMRYSIPVSGGDGWKLSGFPESPVQDGVPLPLQAQESVRCHALRPFVPGAAAAEQALVLVGTDRALVAFDQKGQQRFRTEVPGGVHKLAISGDGHLALAGLADGSLRFYATADGHSVLTLVMERGGERWILFTESGYYDAAVNGEQLLGLQVHASGRSTDDFFPIATFRARRYQPELLSRVLTTRSEERSLNELAAERGRPGDHLSWEQMLPPIVTILDPKEGATASGSQLSMRVLVRTSATIGPLELRTFIEGRTALTRGLRLSKPSVSETGEREQVFDLVVEVPADDCTVTVIAASGEHKSEPASLRLAGQAGPKQRAATKPDLYVLAIGVGDYAQENLRLRFPGKDARDIGRVLREQRGLLYGQVFVQEFVDRQATRDNILAGLSWLRSKATAKDVAVLFLAGHGISDPSDGRYYFLPTDADLASPESTMVDAAQIQTALANTRGRVLLLLDTCHSGNVLVGRSGGRTTDFSRVVNEMASAESGVVVYAASSGAQASRESPSWNNGAFTKAVIEGLRGKADYTSSGRVTVSALELYVGERVRQLTLEQQTPTTAKPTTIADFSLALVSSRGGALRKPWIWVLVGVTAAAGAATAIGLGVASKGPDTTGLPALRPF